MALRSTRAESARLGSVSDEVGEDTRYYYALFYSSQAMFQLGGEFWSSFYPELLDALAQRQQSDGSWPPEPHRNDRIFGNAYTTALAVLALSAPYQLLP